MNVRLSLDEARGLAQCCLRNAGAIEPMAIATADALVAAQADGQVGHGLARLTSYCAQLQSGKANGSAQPITNEISGSTITIDAGYGLSYPALNIAIEALAERAPKFGIAMASIAHGNHFGQAGYHAERLAERGLIGLVFANSPKAIAFWGSTEAALGTNPIAFAAPVPSGPPLVIDMALSIGARAKIVRAQNEGTSIPPGWAMDSAGNDTTDPSAALAGSLLPMGNAKGAALAIMIEILAAALTGSHFGFEADSFFTAEGEPPDIGHALIAIDPARISGGTFDERMLTLLGAINNAEGARQPGISRLKHRDSSHKDGIILTQDLYDALNKLAS